MKEKITLIFKKFYDNSFFKTYTLILLPVFILLCFLLISAWSYNHNYIELLKSSYSAKLETICDENENTMQSVITTMNILSENEHFMQIVVSESNEPSSEKYNISRILTQVMDTNPLIDNIIILDKKNNTVFSNSGTYNAITYFTKYYKYSDYSQTFWQDYTSPLTARKFLDPSYVSTTGDITKIVIPLVFSKIGDVAIDNLVIVNIDLSDIIKAANNSKITENSRFLVVNKINRHIFSDDYSVRFKFDENFYDDSAASSGVKCRVDGKRAFAITYSKSASVFGYAYAAVVPYSDITSSISHLTYFIAILGIIVLILVFIAAYFSTKRIYTPIENLASLFKDSKTNNQQSDETHEKNTLQRLHASIQETLESNSSLSNEVLKALPLIQERYLINLLNANEHYTQEKDVENMPVNFKYGYFCSIVIRLKPTEQFYSLYNNMEYNSIKSGIHNIIQSVFAEKYETYIIPSETDTLYVLLNPENNLQTDSILEILKEFQNVMNFDKDYMTLQIGMGGIYSGLEGLKKSHHEAVNSVSAVTGVSHIKVNQDNSSKKQPYLFTMNDENALLNHLILGRYEESVSTLEKILSDNEKRDISDTSLMQLYIQILNVIFKVMRMKNIQYDPENSGDFHIITEIIKQPIPDVHEKILKYIGIISNHTGTTSSKVDIRSVISYMEEHYNEELSLEALADNFNTTPKYLSKLIKDKLGVNFVDYLAGLRINAAKILLAEGSKNISDIFVEVGFNNRNTFIRTFKKNTGLTPSEFRKTKKRV